MFYMDKLASTWLNPTFQTIWCSYPGAQMTLHEDYAKEIERKEVVKDMLSGKAYKVEENILNIFSNNSIYFCWYRYVKIFKQGKIEAYIITYDFLGGFYSTLFWETKAIYVYNIIIYCCHMRLLE